MKPENISCRPGTTEAMERLAAENESLRAELEVTANLAIKQGEWLQAIVNITKGNPEGLKHHTTYDVVESVEALRVERDELATRVSRILELIDAYQETGFYELLEAAQKETPAQSLAIIQCKAISDAMEYAIDQVGSDASADDCVDAMCEYLEQVSEGKFPTVGSTGNTWRSTKAAGAREALQRAMQTQGFSDTVVRVDRLEAVIADMEKGDE